ncbi:hypothetical protein [Nitriliruptor alkaliphilus]|uniref:hypothetical protein n=1 Tax=Nitriliruptor alkaliphilus TaxID=427918 RepID=UPI0006962669|nr:hypothetical protein [Nitriliruptor alkaliphilus]
MNGPIRRSTWVLGWTLASMLGFALGFLLVFVGGTVLVEVITGDADGILGDVGWGFYLQLTAGFALGGAGVGAAQWLFIRRRVPAAGRWVLGGLLGFAVVAVLYLVLFERVPVVVNELVHNLAGGAVLGLVQLPVVRRLTGRSRPWPILTAGVMVLAGAIAAVLRGFGLGDDLSGPIGVAGLSLVTGLVLSRWINEARSTPDAHEARVPSLLE